MEDNSLNNFMGWFVRPPEETKEVATKETTKSEKDGDHPASHYLVVEDPESPTTWYLRVKNVSGDVDPRLLGAAHAALTKGFRGNKYEGPNKGEAMNKLKSLYESQKMAWPGETKEFDEMSTEELVEYFTAIKEFEDAFAGITIKDGDLSEDDVTDLEDFYGELENTSDEELDELIDSTDAIEELSDDEVKEFDEELWVESFKGKGNFGHVGVPGHRGGSAPRSGVAAGAGGVLATAAGAAGLLAYRATKRGLQQKPVTTAVAPKKPGLLSRYVNYVKRGGAVGSVARGAVSLGKKYVGNQQRNLMVLKNAFSKSLQQKYG